MLKRQSKFWATLLVVVLMVSLLPAFNPGVAMAASDGSEPVQTIDLLPGWQQLGLDYNLLEPEFVTMLPDGNGALVTIQEGSAVTAVYSDGGTWRLADIFQLAAGAEPDGIAVTGDGKLAVTANEENQTVSLLDLSSGLDAISLTGTVDVLALLADETNLKKTSKGKVDPEGIAVFSRNGKNYALVALEKSASLLVLDITDPQNVSKVALLPVGISGDAAEPADRAAEPEGVAVSPDGSLIAVGNEEEGTVSLIPVKDGQNGIAFGQRVDYDPEGSECEIVSFTPDGKKLLVTNSEENQVLILNISSLNSISTLKSISVATYGEPTSVAVHPGGEYALVTVADGQNPTVTPGKVLGVSLQDGTLGQIFQDFTVGQVPDSIAIGGDGKWAVVANEAENSDETDEDDLITGSIAVLNLTGLTPPGAGSFAGAKIAVFADPHYFDPDLLVEEGPAFEEYLARDRKLLAESSAIARAAVDAIKNSDADLVLVPGDLTKDGEMSSHQKFAALLAELEAAGKKVYVINGNHDVNNSDAVKYLGEITEPVDNVTPAEFMNIYLEFGYDEALATDPNSLSYVAEPVPGLRLVVMDAAQYEPEATVEGALSPETLNWVKEQVAAAALEGKLVIGMMHHGLIDHFSVQRQFFPEYIVQDADQVAAELAASGLQAVFTGHFHAQDVVQKQFGSKTLYDIETGSLVTYPSPYRLVEITPDQKVQITTHNIQAIDYDLGGKDFTTYARDYLVQGLNGLIPQIVAGILVAEGLTVKDLLVQAMVDHYQGDETIDPQLMPAIQAMTGSSDALTQMVGLTLLSLGSDPVPADNEVNLPTSITVDPIAKTPGDSVTISGATNLDEVSIKVIRPDGTILYVEVITASNGAYTHTFDLPADAQTGAYTVVAGQGNNVATATFEVTTAPSGNADLSSLVLSAGELTPAFNEDIQNYIASVANSVDSLSVTAVTADAGAMLTINGQAATSGTTYGPIALAVGENEITITVTAADGTVKEYTVTVIREGLPATITIDPIPNRTPGDSVTISGATNLDEVSIKVIRPDGTILYVEVITASNGAYTHTFDLPADAQTGAYTVVAGQGNNVATATFEVTTAPSGNADLSSLVLSAGELTPAFNEDIQNYIASVANSVDSLSVTAVTADAGAMLTINGQAATSGTTYGPIALAVGENEITITVTAADGTVKKYVVIVTRLQYQDETPPSFATGYPKVDNVNKNSVDLLVQTDENGTAYYVVLADGANAPSAAQIKAGQNADGQAVLLKGSIPLTAGSAARTTINGLTAATRYDIYVVVADAVSNLQPAAIKLDITTKSGSSSGGGAFSGSTTPPGAVRPVSDNTVEDALEQADTSGQVVLTAPAGREQIALTVDQLDKIAASDKPARLEVAGVQFTLPPAVVAALSQLSAAQVEVSVTAVDANTEQQLTTAAGAAHLQLAGKILELEITAVTASGSREEISQFSEALTVALAVPAAAREAATAGRLDAYRYNEATGTWSALDAHYDATTQAMIFQTDHLSKYALFEKLEAQLPRTTFADIHGHWAQNEIEIMAGQGIARGVGDNKFNPDGQVTRAEFAAFLLRSLGLEETAPEKGNFPDVAAGSWYYGAVETAYANGLVSGYEDGAFRPEAKITRQEIAAMVTRALNKDGQQIEVEDAESVLSTFADGSIISSWARGSVATAVEAGILRGRGDSLIAPQANATRAEAVVMLYRMLVYLGRL